MASGGGSGMKYLKVIYFNTKPRLK